MRRLRAVSNAVQIAEPSAVPQAMAVGHKGVVADQRFPAPPTLEVIGLTRIGVHESVGRAPAVLAMRSAISRANNLLARLNISLGSRSMAALPPSRAVVNKIGGWASLRSGRIARTAFRR